MTASQPSNSNSLNNWDYITGCQSPDLIKLGTLRRNEPEPEVDYTKDAFTVITDIYRKYCGGSQTSEELIKWLNYVLTSFITNNNHTSRSMQYYRDARITFCESKATLHIEKNSKTCTMLPAGETLTSEIRLSHVFMRKFGVDTHKIREGKVFYDEEDISLFTESVKSDIDTWCDVVHFVTSI